MSLVAAVTNHWTDGKRIHVIGTITASGNYTTGGDTVSLALPQIKSNSAPLFVDVKGQAGYTYQFKPGTSMSNGLLGCYSGGTETAAGAYPGGITGDIITFHAIFHKFI